MFWLQWLDLLVLENADCSQNTRVYNTDKCDFICLLMSVKRLCVMYVWDNANAKGESQTTARFSCAGFLSVLVFFLFFVFPRSYPLSLSNSHSICIMMSDLKRSLCRLGLHTIRSSARLRIIFVVRMSAVSVFFFSSASSSSSYT